MEVQELLNSALPEIARRVQNELIVTCPVDTGRLKNSIKVTVEGDGLLITMVDYGKYVEFGTPPHIIRPVNKQALKFEIGKKDRLEQKGKNKNIVFAKEVKHPGTRPNPFIRTMITNKLRNIIMEELIKAQNNNI